MKQSDALKTAYHGAGLALQELLLPGLHIFLPGLYTWTPDYMRH